ncbi:MAG TPA: hypothetical protein VM677_33245 [Actinokineospora sp.]|nr:hypothetical protein [Actinokineospora sp.]
MGSLACGSHECVTVDLCGLLDRKAVGEVARHRNITADSFDYCVLFAEVDSKDVQVIADLTRSDSAVGGVTAKRRDWLPDPLRLVEHEDVDGRGCANSIVGPGAKAVLTFTAWSVDVDKAKLCAIADVAVKAGAKMIAEDKVEHVDLPATSLGRVDPCTLLNAQQVGGQYPGVSVYSTSSSIKHSCEWGPVSLRVDVEPWPLPPEYVQESLAGRPTFAATSNDGDTPGCELVTGHIERAPGIRETVTLSTYATMTGQDPCVPARRMAALAWPKLPNA